MKKGKTTPTKKAKETDKFVTLPGKVFERELTFGAAVRKVFKAGKPQK